VRYNYKGYDRQARSVSGSIDAANQTEVMQKLKNQNIRPTHLSIVKGTENETPGTVGSRATAGKALKESLFLFTNAKPTLAEMTSFVRQLATMQGAGIPIVQALNVLAGQAENRYFGKVLYTVQSRIEEGMTLTDALRKEDEVFDRIFVNLIGAGEVSGSLEKVLNRLAIYYEKMAALKRKIVSASTYPALIVVMVICIALGLLFFLVPTFAGIFKQNGAKLPEMTQMLLDASAFLRSYWYLVLGGIFGGIYGIYFLFTNDQFRLFIDPHLLNMPIIGDIIRKTATARFSRTLATMLQSGVPLLEAMDITASVAGNSHIEAAILNSRRSIAEGSTISEPLERQKVFPKMVTSMMAVGEQSGSMDQMLVKIADFYEDEVENKVAAATSILEPLMIVFVGGMVLAILIPLYLPLFKLSETITGGQ
jgi:type IV pilus assembly protein PilC